MSFIRKLCPLTYEVQVFLDILHASLPAVRSTRSSIKNPLALVFIMSLFPHNLCNSSLISSYVVILSYLICPYVVFFLIHNPFINCFEVFCYPILQILLPLTFHSPMYQYSPTIFIDFYRVYICSIRGTEQNTIFCSENYIYFEHLLLFMSRELQQLVYKVCVSIEQGVEDFSRVFWLWRS